MNRLPLILSLGCLALSTPAAQAAGSAATVQPTRLETFRLKSGLIEFIEGDLTPQARATSPVALARAFLAENRALLPGDAYKDFDLREVDTQTPGLTHVVFQQHFRGVPVYDSHLVVSIRGTDQVFRSWAKLFPVPATFKVTPKLSYDQAEAAALVDFARPGAWLDEETELVITPDYTNEGHYKLAYRVHLFEDQSAIAKNHVYLIDAMNGAIIDVENRVCEAGPAVGSGVGVWGDVKTLQTWYDGSTYTLSDTTRAMYNGTKGYIRTYKTAYSSSAPLSSETDNYWDTNAERSEVDAHYFAGVVYEYYRTVHNRNSFDNQGSDLKSYTHSSNQNNAFWSGSYMEYGDGDGTNFYPFAGDLGVAAHEMTHGVTQYGANLKYSYQSGALNEAMSDIMAKMEVDNDNWLIGDLVVTDTFMQTYNVWALRDMEDPTFGGLYNPASPLSTYAQPDHMSVYAYLANSVLQDYGGVHINSGIINKWAQLLADGGSHYGVAVTGIGKAKVAKIMYRVNSASYLATTSDFDHFATQIQAATRDVFGTSAPEVSSVVQALQAVGLLSVGCTAKTETESNNGTSTANVISASCTDMTGTMGSSTDADYFKLSIPANKTINGFLRVPYVGDYDLYLYKNSLLATKSVQAGSGIDEKISYTNGSSTTTYYFMVKRYSGSYGASYKYTLNVSW